MTYSASFSEEDSEQLYQELIAAAASEDNYESSSSNTFSINASGSKAQTSFAVF
jgi:hypothetical protein